MASESVLLSSSALSVGVKVPSQVLLSVLIIVVSVPDVVPLSTRLGNVMSSSLTKPITCSEKNSSTAMVSPIVSNVSEIVKLSTEGGVVSTL